MDARDSSSPTAEEDGSVGGGGVSVVVGMAKEAVALFQSRRYADCVEVLRQLLQKKPDDPKVLHNLVIADFHSNGCSDPRELLHWLKKVKRKYDDLAHASGEQMEVASNLESNVSGSVQQFPTGDTGSTTTADKFDSSVVTLNIAVLFYHLHEYALALSMLEPLYQNLKPIDEITALRICLILLDITLASKDASKAADVIHCLERQFGVGTMINQSDNVSVAQQQSLNPGSKSSSAPSNAVIQDVSSSDSSASPSVAEDPLIRTLSDDALEYENLISTMDGGCSNLGRPAVSDASKLSVSWTAASCSNLKLNLHLYKIRFLLLTRNLKAAKREMKLAMDMVRDRDSSTALLLKSQLEYARGNHRKAIKLLMTSSSRTEPEMLGAFYNNVGCIYHKLRKHHTSMIFFTRALRNSLSLRSEKPLKLLTYFQDKSLAIFYNYGMQYLASGKPLAAASCFHRAASDFYDQPLLWLRFAECCLLAQEKGMLRSADSASPDEEAKLHVIGSGKWRKLVVDDANPRNRYLDSIGVDGVFGPNETYRLSLPFARRCLLNALHLLSSLEPKMGDTGASFSVLEELDANPAASEDTRSSSNKILSCGDPKVSNATSTSASANGDLKETNGGLASSSTLQGSVSSYENICRKECHMIKQAVLADLAYVELSLENPLKALSASKALQQLPGCSRMFVFLSHLYAAEALCRLSRPTEAAEQLAGYILEGNNIQLPYSEEDREEWKMEKAVDGEDLSNPMMAKTTPEEAQETVFMKPEEARGILYVNLAAMSAMQGNLEQASHFVTEGLLILPNNPRAILAAVYVELLLGKTHDALLKLRKCSHLRFYPSEATSSSS